MFQLKSKSINARTRGLLQLLTFTFIFCVTALSATAQKTYSKDQQVAVKDNGKWYHGTYMQKYGTLHFISYSITTIQGNMTSTSTFSKTLPDDAVIAVTDPAFKSLTIENASAAPKPLPMTPVVVNTSNDEVKAPAPPPAAAQTNAPPPPAASNPTTTSEIDILFAVTKEALEEAGGTGALKHAYIDEGIRLLNLALDNSQTKVKVRAVPKIVVVDGVKAPATQEEALALLRELSNPNGKFAQVHKSRKDQKADLISFIFNGSYTTAWANLGQLPASFNQPRAAMITMLSGAFGTSYIFAHEFGHILGCAHQSETGATAFASGYLEPNRQWKTVEANGAVSIPYFSTPRTVTAYNPTSRKEETLTPGNAGTADCSRCIRENGNAYSKFSDNLPDVTEPAGSYKCTVAEPTIPSLPLSKTFAGNNVRGGMVFSATKGKKYVITIDNVTLSSGDFGGVNAEGKDAAGNRLFSMQADPKAPDVEKFEAPATGVYTVSINNSFMSNSYRIQVKEE